MSQLTESWRAPPRPLHGPVYIGPPLHGLNGTFADLADLDPCDDLNAELELLGWRMPRFLAALYAQGNGIGPWDGRWLPWAFLPWDEVEPLTRRIRFGEENICFDPADCILVVRDGSGGGWVVQGRRAPVWRRFDGTDHSLGPPLTDRAAVAAITRHWVEPR